MSAKALMRGHSITWDKESQEWRYSENGEIADDSRPCPRCKQHPTSEGYDACLGYIEGVKSACCGHGIEQGFREKE